MAMDWTRVEVPLGGIDRKTDAPHIMPGKVSHLENARFSEPGGYDKRPAYNSMGNGLIGGGSHAAPRTVVQHGDEILMASDRDVHSYVDALGKFTTSRGRAPKFLMNASPVASQNLKTNGWVHTGDIAAANGYYLEAWSEEDSAAAWKTYYHLVEINTGAVAQMGSVNAADRFSCVASGNILILLTHATSGNVIQYTLFDTSDASVGSTTNLVTDATAASIFDVCEFGSNWLLVYYDTSNDIILSEYDNTAAQVDTSTITVALGGYVGVFGTPTEEIYVALHVNATNAFTIYCRNDDAGFTAVGNVTVTGSTSPRLIGMARIDASSILVTWHDSGSDYKWAEISNAPAVTTQYANAQLLACGRPFVHDSRVYGFAHYDDTIDGSDNTYHCYELVNESGVLAQRPYLLASFARGTADDIIHSASLNQLAHTVSPAAGRFMTMLPSVVNFSTLTSDQNVTQERTVVRYELEAATGARMQSAAWGRGRFFAGASPVYYDGEYATTAGHANRPAINSTSIAPKDPSTSGNLFDEAGAGTDIYRWCLVWEWIDANGDVHRSAPSSPAASNPVIGTDVSAAGGPDLTAEVVIPAITLTNHHATAGHADEVLCYVYRNVADPAVGDGSLYYLSGIAEPGDTYEDDVADATIATNDPLYTDGGVLDNAGVPPCKTVVAHAERLWVAGLEDPEAVWFTKRRENGKGPEFNEGLSVRIPGAGKITALGTLDTALVAFTKRETYVIYGDGPNATGTGGTNLPVAS
jgi:hypothetical protein